MAHKSNILALLEATLEALLSLLTSWHRRLCKVRAGAQPSKKERKKKHEDVGSSETVAGYCRAELPVLVTLVFFLAGVPATRVKKNVTSTGIWCSSLTQVVVPNM